jgi:hypothetical protein
MKFPRCDLTDDTALIMRDFETLGKHLKFYLGCLFEDKKGIL